MNLPGIKSIIGVALLIWCTGTTAFDLDLGSISNLTKKIFELNEDVTEEEEIEIGGILVSGLLGAAPLVDNPSLQRYVNDIGLWIAGQTERKDLPWVFGIIDSDGINAFAAPGGYILITRGLYELLDSEAQLAGVLAHEIAHVVEKHHLNALQDTLKAGIWADLALLTATDSPEKRAQARSLVNAGVKIYTSGLDQDLEFNADLHGVVLAARAGYDPFALLEVLTTIDSIDPAEDEMLVLVRTHPSTGERLSKLGASMDDKMDAYAEGRVNAHRFKQVATKP
jgi:predicted Zn-dependent protease